MRKKDSFWQYLDEEAKHAENNGKGFLLQGDLNAWLGGDIVSNDSHPQMIMVEDLKKILISNNLTVVDALKCCKGLIIRKRNRQGQIQESIIDFYVVCNLLLPHVTDMLINTKGEFTITNYKGAKHGRRAVDSDHVTMILNMNQNVLPQKPQKVVMLDLKKLNGKILFTKSTSETNEFTDCFNNVLPLLEQCEKWHKTLQSYCSKSYPIIRIKKNNSKTSYADKLIEKRSHLKKKIDEGKSSDRDELNRIEEQIAEIIEEEETNKAKLFKKYCNESSSINIAEMWKLKQKVWPQRKGNQKTQKD